MPGKGRMTVTGNLQGRDEGIDLGGGILCPLARHRFRHRAAAVRSKRDIHVHVPEGATPKDGPSAGVAMATAIVSIMTGIPVNKDVAMTGEITLRGRVLPIGGLKEKLLAALRGGIKKVLIPEENAKDLADIPDNVKNNMEIIPVSHIGEVLQPRAAAGSGGDRMGSVQAGRADRARLNRSTTPERRLPTRHLT